MAKKPKATEPDTQEPAYTPPKNAPSQEIVERFESTGPEPDNQGITAPDLSDTPQLVHPVLARFLVGHEARKSPEVYAKERITEQDARFIARQILDKERALASLLYIALGDYPVGTQFIYEYRDPRGEIIR